MYLNTNMITPSLFFFLVGFMCSYLLNYYNLLETKRKNSNRFISPKLILL